MCDAARARAASLGVTNVEFVAADAHAYPFEPSADAVFSRFGVMFFGDPKGAFANIRTALETRRPPRVRVLAVADAEPLDHQAARSCPQVRGVSDRHRPARAEPVRVRRPGVGARVLAAAGFADVALEPYEAHVHLGPDIDSAVQFLMGINPATAGIAERDPDLASRLFADVADALRPHLTDTGVVTDSATWVVTATSHD